MAKVKLYLDTRFENNEGLFPIKLVIRHNDSSAMVSVGINIRKEEWDARSGVVIGGKYKKQYNSALMRMLVQYEDKITKLKAMGRLRVMTAKQIRDYQDVVVTEETPIQTYMRMIEGAHPKTKRIRNAIINSYRGFCDFDNYHYDDITEDWVTSYIKYLEKRGLQVCTINHYLSLIKALFIEARKQMPFLHNPFANIKTRHRKVRKRNLSVSQVREIINYPLKGNKAYHRDMFLLSLFLVGMNNVDMFQCKEMRHGRIEYIRSKIERHGYSLSVRVEPEAMEIINKYRGKKTLLDMCERYTCVECFNSASARNLKVLYPTLSSYWARHTWASLASEIGIPIETIAQAMGHTHTHAMTMIYINYDTSKIDEANRRVIDYIFYNKK